MIEILIDQLVPDRQVAFELGNVSSMTLWRWTRNAQLGFPPVVKLNGRNYRRRSDLEKFKGRLSSAPAPSDKGGQPWGA